MKIAAKDVSDTLSLYKPSLTSYLSATPQSRFVNEIKKSVDRHTSDEGLLMPNGIFEIASQVENYIDNSNQAVSNMDDFSDIVYRLAELVGFDVIAAARKINQNPPSSPSEQFRSTLKEIDNTRYAHHKILKILGECYSKLMGRLDALQDQQKYLLNSVMESIEALTRLDRSAHQQKIISETAEKPSGRKLKDYGSDHQGREWVGGLYPEFIPDKAARAAAKKKYDEIQNEIEKIKAADEAARLPFKNKINEIKDKKHELAVYFRKILDEDKIDINRFKSDCHQYQRFIAHFKKINPVCDQFVIYSQQIFGNDADKVVDQIRTAQAILANSLSETFLNPIVNDQSNLAKSVSSVAIQQQPASAQDLADLKFDEEEQKEGVSNPRRDSVSQPSAPNFEDLKHDDGDDIVYPSLADDEKVNISEEKLRDTDEIFIREGERISLQQEGKSDLNEVPIKEISADIRLSDMKEDYSAEGMVELEPGEPSPVNKINSAKINFFQSPDVKPINQEEQLADAGLKEFEAKAAEIDRLFADGQKVKAARKAARKEGEEDHPVTNKNRPLKPLI